MVGACPTAERVMTTISSLTTKQDEQADAELADEIAGAFPELGVLGRLWPMVARKR